MQYRVKFASNGWSHWYTPQKRYNWLPIWFNFHIRFNGNKTKVFFDSEYLATRWLKRTQNDIN